MKKIKIIFAVFISLFYFSCAKKYVCLNQVPYSGEKIKVKLFIKKDQYIIKRISGKFRNYSFGKIYQLNDSIINLIDNQDIDSMNYKFECFLVKGYTNFFSVEIDKLIPFKTIYFNDTIFLDTLLVPTVLIKNTVVLSKQKPNKIEIESYTCNDYIFNYENFRFKSRAYFISDSCNYCKIINNINWHGFMALPPMTFNLKTHELNYELQKLKFIYKSNGIIPIKTFKKMFR